MMAGKDTRKLLKDLQRQGFTITRAKSSHWKVYKGPQLVVVISSTPSDHRAYQNALALLRHAGYVE